MHRSILSARAEAGVKGGQGHTFTSPCHRLWRVSAFGASDQPNQAFTRPDSASVLMP
jgi:hypothetical protein